MDDLAKRISLARGRAGLSQSDVGRTLGVTRAAVSQWESGLTVPGIDRLPGLAEALGADPVWLAFGIEQSERTPAPREAGAAPVEKSAPAKSSGESSLARNRPFATEQAHATSPRITADKFVVDVAGEEYAAVPVYAARAAAGAGGHGEDETPARLLFRTHWLRSVTLAALKDLGVIEVDGDSMEPTLRSGDHVLIDMTQRQPRRKDGVYVLRSAGGLQVKRITAHPNNGRLAIRSDNPAYEAYTDIKPHDVDILGRVIWVGRRL